MSKRLISVIDIKTMCEQGQTEFCVDDNTLVTPAARDAAMEFGVKIVKGVAPACTATVPDPTASPVVSAGCVVERSQAVSPAGKCPPVPGYRENSTLITSPWPELKPIPCSVVTQEAPSSHTTPWPTANPVAFEAISGGKTPVQSVAPTAVAAPSCGGGVSDDLVTQIVKQVMSQMGGNIAPVACPQSDLVRAIDPESGFMLIKGNNLKMEPFNDGEKDRPGISIKEFTNPQESPNLTAGIMEFDHADLTWTLTYDEMDYVIDGTLEFIVNGKKYTGYAGDIFFIPMNTTVTFTTPNKAKFFFVTYPANWADSVNAQ